MSEYHQWNEEDETMICADCGSIVGSGWEYIHDLFHGNLGTIAKEASWAHSMTRPIGPGPNGPSSLDPAPDADLSKLIPPHLLARAQAAKERAKAKLPPEAALIEKERESFKPNKKSGLPGDSGV